MFSLSYAAFQSVSIHIKCLNFCLTEVTANISINEEYFAVKREETSVLLNPADE